MQTQQNRTIGILGGMGPLATVDLFRRIVEMTDSPNDQGHPRVLIDSNTNISDRTAAILNGGADPLPEMVRSALLLERADYGLQYGALFLPRDLPLCPSSLSEYARRNGESRS